MEGRLTETTTDRAHEPNKKVGTGRVVLVQCICCAALVLFFWLFKLCGGGAYMQLRSTVMKALENNVLMETIAQMMDDGADVGSDAA